MSRLLSYQFKYLLRTRSFRVIMSILSCYSAISVLILKYGTNLLPSMPDVIETTDEVAASISSSVSMYGADALISGIGDSIVTLLPILIAIFVSSDFSEGTIRNILTRGYSKAQYYFSKLLTSFVVSTIFIFVSAGIQTTIASLFWGFSNGTTDFARVMLIFGSKIISIFALVSICVLISFFFRRANGIAVAANIIAIRFAPFILTSLASIMKLDINAFSKYEISTIISSLPDSSSCSNDTIFHAIMLSAIYLVLSTSVGILYFKKRDV